MLIDTHAHLNFDAFDQDRKEVISNCLDSNIWVINVGTNHKTSEKAVEIAEKYNEGVYATVGLHPYHIVNSETKENFDYHTYKALAQNKKVKAIGEIGLDYSYTEKKEEKKLQRETFKKQLDLASKVNLPVVIHCRKAWKDLLQILKNSKFKIKNSPNGVAHFYSGSWTQAQELFKLGFFISFTGVITFSEDYNEIVKKTPTDKIMVETDCPYVAPEPNRGKTNKPQYVKYVAREIARIKKQDLKEIKAKTTRNAKELFKL